MEFFKDLTNATSVELSMDWETAFFQDARVEGVHTDSISDALILSLTNLGRVDIPYISTITGETYQSAICALQGSIYQNPDTWEECFYKGWEVAEEYLSGNLSRKWKAAWEANQKYEGQFQMNLEALKKVLPPAVATNEIYVTLGSPWVPTDVIDDFILYIMNEIPYRYESQICKTRHNEENGTWEIPKKYDYRHNIHAIATYGTKRMPALEILEQTLNMKSVVVKDEVPCNTTKSGKKRVINQNETVLALEKQQKLIKTFQEWIWKDDERQKRLQTIFDTRYGCVRRRFFDGSFLQFPGMNPEIQLYPYQKNAVARILFSPNTLLAHDVGSGKTLVMITAGMELKRMGLTKKNLYVVPNNIVGQWHTIFLDLYPEAKLLCVEPKNFTPSKKEQTLKAIRDCEYDGIIIAYSCFERISLSKDFYMEELREELKRIKTIMDSNAYVTHRLERKYYAIKEKLAELKDEPDEEFDTICFDELGITRLFVDEAHNYKNVPIDTKVERVMGISATGSKKCKDMMQKVHLIQRKNEGAGVVMATGTPITNSITDVFIMQSYLQSGELALLDLQNFDSWIGMFAERKTEFEIDVDTNNYRMATRFSKFHNLPELTALLSSIADFHQVDASAGIPEFSGYTDSLIPKTNEFSNYLQQISIRAEDVRKGRVPRTDDNLLKITTDGRKAALDLRLVEPERLFTNQSKVAYCVRQVYDIYIKTKEASSAQLIFCDTSTPKAGFNMYDELKQLLIKKGIPDEQIAFIHDAETEAKRLKLFEKVREGEIRILIGSTLKLGLGVNVQDRLIALHHLDVPWRPADMTQREGRILRQGNQNKKVLIYRYITKGSFDAYSWQLLETKQRFISGLLSGSMAERSGSDIENTILDYAEVKALAIGNPLIKERIETANTYARYMTLQKKTIETRLQLEKEVSELPERIKLLQERIRHCKADINLFKSRHRIYEEEERKKVREKICQAVNENEMEPKERYLMTYQGFILMLPANMSPAKPYLWLKNHGKYSIEIGTSKIGALIRIDNFLERFPKYLEELENGLCTMTEREAAIKMELEKNESYVDKIKACQEKLEQIDKALGVQ